MKDPILSIDKLILPLKRVARPVVWKLLNLYDRTFSPKRKKVKEFDKIVSKNEICFTTDINTEGFSDQLCRLNFFYKIGNRLGMKYFYTPLISTRSNPATKGENDVEASRMYSDIHDFLGVNTGLKRFSTQLSRSNVEEIVFDLDQIEFEKRIRTSYKNLLYFLKLKLRECIPEGKKVLVHFRGSPNVFDLYRLAMNPQTRTLPLREFYVKNRKENPRRTKFDQEKIRLMVHIRQGDCAIIETPWDTFIPVWYESDNRFTEVGIEGRNEEIKVLDVDTYYQFLQRLVGQFKDQFFSTVMFSDGFKKAFQIIEQHGVLSNSAKSKKDEFKKLEKTYDETHFRDFYEWDEVDTVVGEEEEKLFDLVQSFFEADIIVFGTQAKMIPKLISIYTKPETMPLIINLYQEKKPHIAYLGIDISLEQVLFVDVTNYDIEQVARRIKQYLASRNRL